MSQAQGTVRLMDGEVPTGAGSVTARSIDAPIVVVGGGIGAGKPGHDRKADRRIPVDHNQFVEQSVKVPAGWWLASPEIVEE